MKIIFWNFNKNTDISLIDELVELENPEILAIAETGTHANKITLSLKKINPKYYHITPNNSKIEIFTTLPTNNKSNIIDEGRLFGFQFYYQKKLINVFFVHLQDKLHHNIADQTSFSKIYADIVKSYEDKFDNKISLVAGDFNMNPFEIGMIESTGFHSVSDFSVANKMNRTIDSRKYDFFYNPMWSFLGDQSLGNVAGTYYYWKSSPTCFFWNIFDQFLIRPQFANLFKKYKIEILTNLNNTTLVKPNSIIDDQYSDHLPIKIIF
ncbi:MAG: hypothetical protein ABJI69_06240 [Balneola sp.]